MFRSLDGWDLGMMGFPDQEAILAAATSVVKEPPDCPLGSATDGTWRVTTVKRAILNL